VSNLKRTSSIFCPDPSLPLKGTVTAKVPDTNRGGSVRCAVETQEESVRHPARSRSNKPSEHITRGASILFIIQPPVTTSGGYSLGESDGSRNGVQGGIGERCRPEHMLALRARFQCFVAEIERDVVGLLALVGGIVLLLVGNKKD
jgi:hypothetical protein